MSKDAICSCKGCFLFLQQGVKQICRWKYLKIISETFKTGVEQIRPLCASPQL